MEINSSTKANGHSNGNGHSNTNGLDSQAKSKLVDQLLLLLAPECLEVSKVLSILHDDFSFKLDDLLNLKEIQKLSTERDVILSLLKEFKFLKISDDEKTVHLVFSEAEKIINLINVPNKIGGEALMNVLKINESMIQRLYKQSLYWTIVCDNKEVFNKLDETMRNIKFEDNNPLKFEITLIEEIKKTLCKKINHQNYLKEADSLKASGANGLAAHGLSGDRRESRGWKGSIGANNEALSWRKKSDISANSRDDAGIVKGANVSAFNSNGSKIQKRERFNSDCSQKKTVNEETLMSENLPHINVDPKLVKYDLNVNYKYSFREMFEYYEKSFKSLTEQNSPFKTLIEDICSIKIKKVNVFSDSKLGVKEQKDRAYTFSHNLDDQGGNWRNRRSAFEINTDLKSKVPTKNPLHDISQRANIIVKNN